MTRSGLPNSACSVSWGCSSADSRSRRWKLLRRVTRMPLTRSRRSARWSARAWRSSSRWMRPPPVTACWRRFASSPVSSLKRAERQPRPAAATPSSSATWPPAASRCCSGRQSMTPGRRSSSGLTSGRLQEAQSWCAELLARRSEVDDSLAWAKVLHGSALQLWGLGDLAQAEAAEESAVETFRSAGEDRWLSYGLALMARIRTGQERLPEAEALLEEARSMWARVTVTSGQPFDASLRFYLGGASLVRGDVDTTRAHFEASARELEAAGDDTAHGAVLGGLGLLAAQRGEHAEARATFARALPLLRPGADQWDLALVLLNSGLEEAQAASPAAAGRVRERRTK